MKTEMPMMTGLGCAVVGLTLAATVHGALAEPPIAEPAAAEAALGDATPAEAPEAAAAAEPSGVLVPEAPDASWLWLPRALLYPLKLTAAIGLTPLRGGVWLVDHYKLRERAVQLLFSDDGSFGLYPTAFFETGLGLNVGAHLVDHDLAGHGEHLSLSAGYGGSLKQRYDASLTSGALLGATAVGVRGIFRIWNKYNYFGVGNDTPGVQTTFAQHVLHGELVVRRPVAEHVSAQVVAAYSARTFDPFASGGGGERTGELFDPMSLVGFAHGTSNVYGEVELAVDTTSYADRYIPRANPSAGWLASGFAGTARGLATDPSHYFRYGGEVRRFIDLYRGDRVVVLHAALEGVTGARDTIPVVDLPRLGGSALLRGFHEDRYRDRIAALTSAEYRFPIEEHVTAYGFVDAGRVAQALPELRHAGWHVGAGGGLQLQTQRTFLVRLQVAASSDGTLIELAFDPGLDTRARRRRL